MKILLIGGYGYLGPIISKVIKNKLNNASVDVADSMWFKKTYFSESKAVFDNVYEIDKRNIDSEILKNYDIVVDLAAVSNDPMGNDFESATMDINSNSTLKIANLCKSSNVKKFIFASSCSIYGSAGNKPRDEDDDKDPLTAYAKSKWYSEQELEKISDENFPIISLRFATACGWSPHFRSDLVLNDFVITSLTEKKIIVLSDGTPWRPLIHVKDIGLAVSWACYDTFKGYNYFNIGSNKWTLTIGELANKVGEILNVPVEITNDNGPDKRSYRVSFDKFNKRGYGWLPVENVNTAVSEISLEASKNIELFKNFRNGPLIRLNVLRQLISSGQLDNSLMWRKFS